MTVCAGELWLLSILPTHINYTHWSLDPRGSRLIQFVLPRRLKASSACSFSSYAAAAAAASAATDMQFSLVSHCLVRLLLLLYSCGCWCTQLHDAAQTEGRAVQQHCHVDGRGPRLFTPAIRLLHVRMLAACVSRVGLTTHYVWDT